eukprot:6236508-Prymnesium_polylepis.1
MAAHGPTAERRESAAAARRAVARSRRIAPRHGGRDARDEVGHAHAACRHGRVSHVTVLDVDGAWTAGVGWTSSGFRSTGPVLVLVESFPFTRVSAPHRGERPHRAHDCGLRSVTSPRSLSHKVRCSPLESEAEPRSVRSLGCRDGQRCVGATV